jgi:hypothetical protein
MQPCLDIGLPRNAITNEGQLPTSYPLALRPASHLALLALQSMTVQSMTAQSLLVSMSLENPALTPQLYAG